MPSNEIQSVVESNVRIDYASGSIVTHDPFTGSPLRFAIADAELALSLLNTLSGSTRDDGDSVYAFGQTWGGHFYDTLATRIEVARMDTVRTPQDFLKEEFVEHLNAHFSYAGVGQFRIMEGNKFYAIDVHNPVFKDWSGEKTNFQGLFAGFFAGLFSRLAEKPLRCVLLDADGVRWRFALSKDAVIEEIQTLAAAGKSAAEIVTKYRNEHFA